MRSARLLSTQYSKVALHPKDVRPTGILLRNMWASYTRSSIDQRKDERDRLYKVLTEKVHLANPRASIRKRSLGKLSSIDYDVDDLNAEETFEKLVELGVASIKANFVVQVKRSREPNLVEIIE